MNIRMALSLLTFCLLPPALAADPLYLNPEAPLKERVTDLISHLSLQEKVSQLMDQAPPVFNDVLDIPGYGWWNEALHGVARNGLATVFPQAIALAATWDEKLMHQVADAISDEARAKYQIAKLNYDTTRYQGLTFFSPNINIFRDPRWGRGHETYGEDPYLTGKMAVQFIKGMQGDDPRYLKTVATAKHFAVHSGPEGLRHSFDARVSLHDLYDTYLPQFEMTVKEGKVESVMSAYNRLNGVPASASPFLLTDLLRNKWGFQGYVVTDCWALYDLFNGHQYSKNIAEAVAASIKAGVDLECADAFRTGIPQALQQGLLTEKDLDTALERLFTARFKLGMFDPKDRVPYNQIPYSVVDSAENRQLARLAAQKSLVLLKNQNNLLPISSAVKSIAVIGPTASDEDVLLGNYNGTPSESTTLLEGLQEAAQEKGIKLSYSKGSPILGSENPYLPEALQQAKDADLVVLVLGITPHQEGEENESPDNPSGDRKDIRLPQVQEDLLKAVIETGKPVALVLTGGSAQAISYAREKAGAILVSWYSGEEGGHAVADVLFGKSNPAGRLPITFYSGLQDLPDFNDYAIQGRTYRYYQGKPLWGFGYGLSYSSFGYSALALSSKTLSASDGLKVTVQVKNTSQRDGEEVSQLYIRPRNAPAGSPRQWLAGFARTPLKAGESQQLQFQLGLRELGLVNEQGERLMVPGTYDVFVGGSQPSEADFSGQQATFVIR
ncbi:glycoside hydrolase family 3 C-terminal domain-containing protein [Deinococcus roseus]|uniref:Glycosyl hydrolase n=1 Tax=Deinococcus roseus TaxID=392414 RepID=A0ABQ2D1F8_9DEIO|nr:glycoside hydrolase family 3 C-terminal domain-containing protein [Deinococcus roseus]GGJ38561.1 glycosyl hydrolase [Deinococcus roseus]